MVNHVALQITAHKNTFRPNNSWSIEVSSNTAFAVTPQQNKNKKKKNNKKKKKTAAHKRQKIRSCLIVGAAHSLYNDSRLRYALGLHDNVSLRFCVQSERKSFLTRCHFAVVKTRKTAWRDISGCEYTLHLHKHTHTHTHTDIQGREQGRWW